MSELVKRRISITQNIVGICRYLRTKGYAITITEEKDALLALQLCPPISESVYLDTLRACLSKTEYQFRKFDEFYKDYIFELKKAVDAKEKRVQERKQQVTRAKPPSLESLKSWLFNKPSQQQDLKAAYSDIESLITKDFALMNGDEIDLIKRLLQKIAAQVLRKESRIRKISKREKHLDLKLTLSNSLRRGGELDRFIFSQRKIKKLRLVLLCDVSQSMDLYSQFFIQFMYAFHQADDRINTYVFSTALHDTTGIFQNYNFHDALQEITQRIPHWSGGTRIGQCLDEFVSEYSHTALDKKTIVMVLSDGWDKGEPELLAEAMRKIRSRSRKIIWLNPLAGHTEFQPEAIGLQSAWPYIHDFYAAHNLASLKKVAHQL